MSFNARISITLHKSNAKQLRSFVSETLVQILTLIGNIGQTIMGLTSVQN